MRSSNAVMKFGSLAMAAAFCMIGGPAAQACPGGQSKTAALGTALGSTAALAKLGLLQGVNAPARPRPDAANADPDPAGAIVGLWQVNFLAGGQVIGTGFDLWHSDGTEVLVDDTPPALGNVCTGIWVQTGALTYKLLHPSLSFDETGAVNGTVILRYVITLDRAGNKYTGTVTIDVFDLNGKLVDHEEGQVAATRMKP